MESNRKVSSQKIFDKYMMPDLLSNESVRPFMNTASHLSLLVHLFTRFFQKKFPIALLRHFEMVHILSTFSRYDQ